MRSRRNSCRTISPRERDAVRELFLIPDFEALDRAARCDKSARRTKAKRIRATRPDDKLRRSSPFQSIISARHNRAAKICCRARSGQNENIFGDHRAKSHSIVAKADERPDCISPTHRLRPKLAPQFMAISWVDVGPPAAILLLEIAR